MTEDLTLGERSKLNALKDDLEPGNDRNVQLSGTGNVNCPGVSLSTWIALNKRLQKLRHERLGERTKLVPGRNGTLIERTIYKDPEEDFPQ